MRAFLDFARLASSSKTAHKPLMVPATVGSGLSAHRTQMNQERCMKTKKTQLQKQDLAKKVSAYLRAKEAGRRGYERADLLIREIAAKVKPGQEIEITVNGRNAVLIDRFKGKEIVWQPCAARRWEIEVKG
jgi:hypothetical protein